MVLNKELADAFRLSYSNINFVSEANQEDYYAAYKIGYPLENWQSRNPLDPRTIPLQKVASSVLGLDFQEEKPILTFLNCSKKYKKYVTIATQSTAQCKYWNNEGGWDTVVEYLNNKGFTPFYVSIPYTKLVHADIKDWSILRGNEVIADLEKSLN